MEHQSVRKNRRQHQPRNLFRDLHILFLIHFVKDRRSAADRLIPEIHRSSGLKASDSVMVDNLQNRRSLESVYSLRLLVMIDKYDFLSVHVQEIPPADHAAVFAFFV